MTRKLLTLACLALVWSGCRQDKPAPPPAPAPTATKAPPAPPRPKPEEISITSSSPEAMVAFKKGRYLAENARIPEGVVELSKAAQLDPNFALAVAYQGFFNPTEEGLRVLEKASKLAGQLPEAERLYVDHLLTWRQGDDPTLRTQRKRLAQLAPNDWRVHLELGIAAGEDKNHREAEAEFRKAIELNPEAGAAYDNLGRALMGQGKFEDAIAALQTYSEKIPTEPNGFDLLGEAQLRAGKLAEAEASFTRATELSSAFVSAWTGLATTRFLQGQWEKGREALEAGRKQARPADQLDALVYLFWSHLAEGHLKEALRVTADIDRDAKAAREGLAYAMAPVLRAAALTESGRHADALREIGPALDRVKKVGLTGDALSRLYRTAFLWRLRAELRSGRPGDAEKSLAFLAKAVSMSLSPDSTSTRSFAQGLVSGVKGEKEIAIQQLLECNEDDWLCRVELANVKEQAGDSSGAQEIRQQISSANRRDGTYLYARALVSGAKPGAENGADKHKRP